MAAPQVTSGGCRDSREERLYSGSTPFKRCQTYLLAPWSPLRRQYTKANSVKSMHDLAIPPFWGDGQMANKCQKFIYEYREQISYPPSFAPVLKGYCPFGGILAHFAIHNGQKMGGYVIYVACQNHIFIIPHYRPLPRGLNRPAIP